MSATGDPMLHPDLERYYDGATDRAALDAHLATCAECRAWLAEIDERLRDLSCREYVELVTEYLDGAADDRMRARIDDHLRLCEGCRSHLDQMRSALATMGRVSRGAEPPDPVQAGLLAAFRAWRRTAPGPRSLGD